jgi:hypothetical protein
MTRKDNESPPHLQRQPVSAVLLAFWAVYYFVYYLVNFFQDDTKEFPSVEWKRLSISNLQEITRAKTTRVIIDNRLAIRHFHSTA